jgi:hypothetical protein
MNNAETIANFIHVYVAYSGETALIVFSSSDKIGMMWIDDKETIKNYTKDPKVKVFKHTK